MAELPLEEIIRIGEFSETKALVDLVHAATPAYAEEAGIRLAQKDSAIAIVCAKVGWVVFNRVVGLGITEPATEALLDELTALYETTGNRRAVQLAPTAQPAQLPEWLKERGFVVRDSWMKFLRGVEPPPDVATDLRVERIGPDRAEAWAGTAAAGFNMPDAAVPWMAALVGRPGWHHYAAFDGDTPVATGALFATEDETGWLGIAATLPSHRRRGAQSAILAARIRDAAALGCKWLTIETGKEAPDKPNPSYHNILRVGFKEAYLRANYIYNPGD